MPPALKPNTLKWLSGGDEIFPALLAAIDRAQKTIRLEVYTFANDELGKTFREILLKARERGARVQVLVDAFGSRSLAASFLEPLMAAGGEVRWFSPVFTRRLGFRDHRKMLVCDEELAIVGGFNIAAQYQGDGVRSGWYDLGLQLVSPLTVQLAAAFDEMFARAGAKPPRFRRLTRTEIKRDVTTDEGKLFLSGPGRGRSPFKRALSQDLAGARDVQIIVAYFLPTWRIRRELLRVVRNGGRVRLIFPAKTDVPLSQLACRSLYRRLLRAGIEIYEYQPQILHAKLVVIDNLVYVGSSNLDPRSLYINYELMVRFENKNLVAEAREIFARTLKQCRRIELDAWRNSRTWWSKLKQRWAYFLLVRVDPLVARWDYRRKRH